MDDISEKDPSQLSLGVGKFVIDTFILSRCCQNVFNVTLKYWSLGGFSVSAVFTLDSRAVSGA